MSMRPLLRRARAALVRQADAADCGAAALATLIRFHGGDVATERLRALSGTASTGTTLLGLYQAAEAVGMKGDAFEAPADADEAVRELRALGQPAILHVVKDERLLHYVVVFGTADGGFVVGDPGEGVQPVAPTALTAMWRSRALLTARPAEGFVQQTEGRRAKWQWLRGFVRPDLNVLGLALALGALAAALALATALFLQTLVDDVLPARDGLRLGVGVGLLGVLTLARVGLGWMRGRLLLAQSRDLNVRIIGGFAARLLRLPQPFFDRRRTGDLVARMNDAQRLQRAVTFVLSEVALDALLLVAAAVYVLSVSPPLGVLALVALPLYALITARFHRPILSGQRDVMAAHARSEAHYVDTIQGIEAVKAAGLEGHASTRTHDVFAVFQERTYRLGRVGLRFEVVAECISVLLLLGFLGGGAASVLRGALSLGAFVGVLQMATALLPAALRLALTNVQIQEARVAFERLHELAALPPEVDAREDAARVRLTHIEAVEVADLRFRFAGRALLLDGVSFAVRRGERLAVLGESGCGKTTLLKVLQRFYEPESGTLVVNGVPWGALSTAAWRQHVAVVPQHVTIFSGTLAENVDLADADADAVARFCEALGFDRFFAALPQRYATVVGEGGVALSGGQRQLVGLARALYRCPHLLLLDEVTSAMDRETEAWALNLLERLRPEMAVILVTHRTRPATVADYLVVLREGQVEASGTPAALRHGNNQYARALQEARAL